MFSIYAYIFVPKRMASKPEIKAKTRAIKICVSVIILLSYKSNIPIDIITDFTD